jgi:hypothetical protein
MTRFRTNRSRPAEGDSRTSWRTHKSLTCQKKSWQKVNEKKKWIEEKWITEKN